MPIYKYFGAPARYHGKSLFHIICNLKDFGRGRIITRASFSRDEKPSFYRILFAQPLMDQKTEEGRAIVEKVRNGVRYTEPVDLSQIAALPDFMLVPKHLEQDFCQWETLRDYSPEKDYVVEPKFYTMPPLLRLVMEREMRSRGEEPASEESFLLPHYKTFNVKDVDVLEEGKEEKYQETITRCEGTADYNYSQSVNPRYHYGLARAAETGELDKAIGDTLARMPEEAPVPGPEVGMRLYKIPWSDMEKRNNKDEPRLDVAQ